VPLRLDPELVCDCIEDIDVEALHGLAVGGQELAGGVACIGADLDHARVLNALGQLCCKIRVLADRNGWGTLGAGLATQ
jgi:hypothetical protein